MKKLLTAVAVVLIALLSAVALGEVAQPNEDFWYLDEANVLSEATEGEIFFANQQLYDACGAEIVVVTIKSSGRLSLQDYTYTLFNEWEIGGDTYLGFLLVMAIDDDDYYAMTGTKLDSYIDSAAVGDLLDRYLEPDFAAGHYDAGAKAFFEAAYAEVVDQLNLNLTIDQALAEYRQYVSEQSAPTQNVSDPRYESREDRHYGPSFGQILLIVLLLILIFGRMGRRRGFSWVIFPRVFRPHFHGSVFFGPRPPHPGPWPPRGPEPGGNVRRPSSRPGGSSFGGASRGGLGGFGGASRSGGASRGPSTRGGGAGRGGRR